MGWVQEKARKEMTEEVRELLEEALALIVSEWGKCSCIRFKGAVTYLCLQCRLRKALKEGGEVYEVA